MMLGMGTAAIPLIPPEPVIGACPAGYAVGTFASGLDTAVKGLPWSLVGGPINAFSIFTYPLSSGSGNVLGPDGSTPCHQANMMPVPYLLGVALPGVAAIGAGLWLLFRKVKS